MRYVDEIKLQYVIHAAFCRYCPVEGLEVEKHELCQEGQSIINVLGFAKDGEDE